jgi:uncharacterized protein (TIRG00374 family)
LAIVFLAVLWIGMEAFSQAWDRISYETLLWVLLLLGLSLVIRGWRAKITMVGSICSPSVDYTLIAVVHNAANQLMPMRSGELAYPFLLKRFHGHLFGKGTASLLYIRFFELFVLAIIFVIALIGYAGIKRGFDLYQISIGVAVLLPLTVVIWSSLPKLTGLGSHFLTWWAQGHSGAVFDIARRVSHLLASISEELKVAKSPVVHMATGVLTIVNWFCLFTIFYLVLHGVGIFVTVNEIVIGSAIASLTQFIPVGTLGNFGSMEAGWTVGFVMVGVDMRSALNSGLVMHLMVFSYSILLAIVSWLGLLLMQGRRD